MFGKLVKPQYVLETEQSTKKKNFFIEILLFFAVFFVATIGSAVTMVPFIIAKYMSDPQALNRIAGGDIEYSIEYYQQIISSDFMTLVSLFLTLVTTLIILLYCRLVEKRKFAQMGFRKKGILSQYLIGLAVGFVMFSAAVFISVLTGDFRINGLSAVIQPGTLILFFIGFLLQGMSEEVLCRGYLLGTFANGRSIWVGVVVNSVIFMALHCMNPGVTVLAFINLFLFGFFASLYIIKTGNIWGIAAIHSIWNFVQGNFYGIQVSGMTMGSSVFTTSPVGSRTLINGGSFGAEGGLGVTIVLVVGCVILLFLKDRKVEPEPIWVSRKKAVN